MRGGWHKQPGVPTTKGRALAKHFHSPRLPRLVSPTQRGLGTPSSTGAGCRPAHVLPPKELGRPGPPRTPSRAPCHHRSITFQAWGPSASPRPELRAQRARPGGGGGGTGTLQVHVPGPLPASRAPSACSTRHSSVLQTPSAPLPPGPGGPVVHSRGRSGDASLNSKPSRVRSSPSPARASHLRLGLLGAEPLPPARPAVRSAATALSDSGASSEPGRPRQGAQAAPRPQPAATAGLAGAQRASARRSEPGQNYPLYSRNSGNCSLNPRTNRLFNPQDPGSCSSLRERLFSRVLSLGNYRSPDNKFKYELNQQPDAIYKVEVSDTLTCFTQCTMTGYLNTKAPFLFCITPILPASP